MNVRQGSKIILYHIKVPILNVFKNDNGINRVKNNHIRAYGLQIILLVIYEKTSYMIKVSMEVTTHKISFTKKKKQF